jgi:hypothetical protein
LAEQIFISMAAYRDPELGPTIEDCLAKASRPERLRFCVLWQRDPSESLSPHIAKRVELIEIDWRESRGAGWARAELMKRWDGEDWYLQLDSHHRFVEGWDELLLEQAASSGSERPVLTTCVAGYTPGEPLPDDPPMRLEFDAFTEDGILVTKASAIPDWQQLTRPYRARFLCAHLLFAPGRFVLDVPYDPDLYFTGEEITLAVRAFTNGYDLFAPSRPIAWHEFIRDYRSKHWHDHQGDHGPAWHELDGASRTKIESFFSEPTVGRFGLGSERSLAEYEVYAGVSFRHRQVQDYTRRHLEPPNPPASPDWPERVVERRVVIAFPTRSLPQQAFSDADLWYVACHDEMGNEVFRADADANEIATLGAPGVPAVVLERRFESEALPTSWTVIPYLGDDRWLDPVTGSTDFSRYRPRLREGVRRREVDEYFRLDGVNGSSTDHIANAAAMLLLELADGAHSVREIVGIAEALGPSRPMDETEVAGFFASASQLGLIELTTTEESNGHA